MKYILLLIILISLWAIFVEPNLLVLKRVNVSIPELKGLKIVLASDFHIKPYETLRLKRIVKKINAQNPDIILLGGDYVNGHTKNMSLPIKKIANELSKLDSKLGTYAVVGNHDGWQGKTEAIEALTQNGIKVLFNSNICLENVCIAGVDDIQTGNPNVEKAIDGTHKPIILLTHNPDIMPKVPYDVDLTLAGHLHGGQVRLNGAIIAPSVHGTKYANGYLEENGKKIYTTMGLGSSILPIRFNCPPEIAVITFD